MPVSVYEKREDYRDWKAAEYLDRVDDAYSERRILVADLRILARASVHRGKYDSIEEPDERYEEPELKRLRDPEQGYSKRSKHSWN